MKKIKKINSNDSFEQKVKSESCIYIGNLNSKSLSNNELNKIINQFLISSPAAKQTKINSIKVFKDCVYIYFMSKNDALNAANFFNNFTYKNSKFDSFLINSIDSNLEIDNQNEAENYDEYDCKNIFWTDSIECEILVSNRLLKKYADTINDRLQKSFFGLNTFVKYSNNDVDQEQYLKKDTIRNALNRNLLYLITINNSNEKYNSLNLTIFNKWRYLKSPNKTHVIKENKNIPSNKAFDIIRSDYRDYLDYVKDIYLKSKTQQIERNTNVNVSLSEPKDDQLIKKEVIDSVFDKFKDFQRLGHEEIDFLLCYLSCQKSKLLSNSETISHADYNQNVYSTIQPNIPQPTQQINQNIQALMQPQTIPSLLSQPFILPNPHIQQPINFMPTLPNSNNSVNQIPALMSLQNRAKMPNQRVPPLMTLRPNYRPSGPNQHFNNNKRH